MSWYRETFFPRLETRVSKSFSRYKEKLLETCRGEVLEIGFGAGLSLPFYGPAVSRLVAVEPNAGMRRMADMGSVSFPVELKEGVAESIPFPESSFESAVSLLTLCTVQDLEKTISELYRVLRPKGRLFFLEHTLQPKGFMRSVQKKIQPAWGKVACGCHLDRDTVQSLKDQGFAIETLEAIGYSGFPNVVAPVYLGIALKS